MNVRFHPDAETEFNQAIDYYDNIQPQLGLDFALEVQESIQRIIDFPETWVMLNNDIRRSLVNRFPYGVLYSVETDYILIIAVMNLHREPNYWLDRL